jgi:hypothetical protein
MAMMFNTAMQRMVSGEHGQVMPVSFTKVNPGGEPIVTQGYELQWMERMGIDPEDSILCRYRVRDPDDIKRMNDAFERRQAIQSLAKQ